MQIWILTGHSIDIGLWDPEIFTTKEDALNALCDYADEYAGDVLETTMSSDEAFLQVTMHEMRSQITEGHKLAF